MYLQTAKMISIETPVTIVEGNALLKYLSLRCLWVTKIHHLVQQFIYDDEVVSYTFLLELFEILGEDLNDLVEEEKDFGRIGVALCKGEEVQVVMANVEVLSLAQHMDLRYEIAPGSFAYIDTLI